LDLEGLDSPLQVRAKIATVTVPELGAGPILSCDSSTTLGFTALALKLVVRASIDHRVVDADLLARMDPPHGHHGDLAVHSSVRIAAVIHVVGRFRATVEDLVKALLDLNRVRLDGCRQEDQPLVRHDHPIPDHKQFPRFDIRQGEYPFAALAWVPPSLQLG
jgi:hypothetical protein